MAKFTIGDTVIFNIKGGKFDINYGKTSVVKFGDRLIISDKTEASYGFVEDIVAKGKAHWFASFVENEFILYNKLGVQSRRVD